MATLHSDMCVQVEIFNLEVEIQTEANVYRVWANVL